jgi:hypothetical protein
VSSNLIRDVRMAHGSPLLVETSEVGETSEV